MRNLILPIDTKNYGGFAFVRIITAACLLIIVARSCIHLFTVDGGAESIAGIDTGVAGGNNIIAVFHQWGAIQLLLVSLMIVLFLAYRGLTPLVILFIALDPPMRAMAGMMGKIESAHIPPGEALNWPAFFFLAALFAVSLVKKKTKP